MKVAGKIQNISMVDSFSGPTGLICKSEIVVNNCCVFLFTPYENIPKENQEILAITDSDGNVYNYSISE